MPRQFTLNRTLTRLFFCVFLFSLPLLAASSISTSEAKNHIGENATVCGQVASTHYAPSTHGQPTFINLDQPYPNQIFTIVIWGTDRAKFGAPEAMYRGKRVCVTGEIKLYRGTPETIASDPSQISVK